MPCVPRLAASVQRELAKDKPEHVSLTHTAAEYMGKAVSLDPQDASLRIDYAEMLCEAGLKDECLDQLRQAERIDAALFPESDFRLTDDQRRRIKELQHRARSNAG